MEYNPRKWTEVGVMNRLTLCFFSSNLSEAASLAAVRRVVAFALVWPFATSGRSVSALGRCKRGRGGEGTFVALLGCSGRGALDGLGGLVNGVP